MTVYETKKQKVSLWIGLFIFAFCFMVIDNLFINRIGWVQSFGAMIFAYLLTMILFHMVITIIRK